jgi:hypothetical protein
MEQDTQVPSKTINMFVFVKGQESDFFVGYRASTSSCDFWARQMAGL